MKSDFSFNRDVLLRSSKIPVMLEISSPGCGPCIWMEKTLIDVTREMNGSIEFISLPISEHPNLQMKYQVNSNPTTLLFIDGKDVARLNGALPKMVVEQWIRDHI